MRTKNKFLKRATALICVCALTAAVLLSGCKDNAKKETPSEPKIEKTVNITDEKWKKLVEKPGTADENWTPAISAAIKYAAENGCHTVYAPAGEYPCEASYEKEAWELEPASFVLPDAPLTIKGDGESTVFYKPVASKLENSIAMFRTAFKSTSEITLKDFTIKGTYNPGPNYGLVDGIVINGSSNVTVENICTEGTKRHGIYLMCGANGNVIKNVHIDNPTRMMLGTGIQLEGAYNNEFYNVYLTNIGANAIDLNMWNAGSFYPANDGTNNSPYSESEKYYSTGNTFIGGYISGTGLHNGNIGGGGYIDPSPHDDYYGINVINGSNNNKFVFDYIENVRMTETDYENAAAIRLMNSSYNTFEIGRVSNSTKYAVRYNSPVWSNEITIGEVSGIAGELFNSEEADAARNNLVIKNQ
ncbi:MAG: right-handed parallel beta-helix repeat-containing protein [Clostridia bacterium]|nr:right-handed parallel beta-helix repeat-containing protein [Clostridia bacterium]